MKTLKINLLTLIALLLIIAAAILFIYFEVNTNSNECTINPVDYANNHSDDYGWDYVMPIYYRG